MTRFFWQVCLAESLDGTLEPTACRGLPRLPREARARPRGRGCGPRVSLLRWKRCG